MSMHGKTDSEVTSLAPSSPNRNVYYVQSPSRDSHDGEKTTNSFHSTPIISPMGSPGRHSRDSSSTRYSGSLKPGSQKSSNGSRRHGHHPRKGGEKEWKEFDAIEEEALLDEESGRGPMIPRRCYFPAFVVGFILLFTFFSLILWGASRNQKPIVTMKSVTFDQFAIQAGSDESGVSTEMATVNSTVKLTFRNKGTFLGVHVAPATLYISLAELPVAAGTTKKFYQSRRSQRTVSVNLRGVGVPLYGGGAGLASKEGKPILPVGLSLNFTVKATAYVLGKLVKPKFKRSINCAVIMDPKKMGKPISLNNSCTYQ